MKNPFEVAVRWRVRRNVRALLPLELAPLTQRIAELEKRLDLITMELSHEQSLLRNALELVDTSAEGTGLLDD